MLRSGLDRLGTERAGHMVEIVRPDEVARAILSD
jgi:hypothetical protein